MIRKKSAVIALSGGMDSCVTAAIAVRNYELAALHVNYGQRTLQRELKAFNDVADYFGIERKLTVNLNHLAVIGGSSLTDRKIEVRQADLSDKEIPATYVPFRNANILAACVSWAEVINAGAIFIGAVYEDSSGYPDCRPEFYSAFEKVISVGTKPGSNIIIETPVIHFTKTEIVKKGMELKAPFNLTWSCYKNEDKACGVCDSCALRLRGFQQAGFEDPIEYEFKPDYSLKPQNN
jgi:7-cyano-7-deazaguanine synthase